jgi:thiamine pyrophosphate-dependent acetolactate synthase large subunit-like protein
MWLMVRCVLRREASAPRSRGPGAVIVGMPTSFAEAVAAAVAQTGTVHVFGIMGSGNMRVLHHLEHDHSVAFHAARHESAAVAAADGFARVTDAVGVCVVTQGPGLTNTITPLITARRAGTPLVLITGDSAEIDSGRAGDALGLVGGFARPSVQAAVNACDCALVVGAGLNGFTTDRQTLLSGADVIHVDRASDAFGRHRPAAVTVTGDGRIVAELLATPDLAEVARAMGARGERIDALGQLGRLPDWLSGLDRPLVLDCRISRGDVAI